MKRFTKTVLTVLAAVVLVFALVLAGCSGESVSVRDILKTSSNADGDVYTIYYSDGTSSTITVSSREAGDPDRFVDHFAPAHNVVTSKASPVTLFWYRMEITGL